MDGFANDIPMNLATRAHAGTSHDPDARGRSERAEYVGTLVHDHAELKMLANTPEKVELLDAEFTRYRAGYRRRYLDRLAASSRCVSTMIAGPSGFNTVRARKASDRADKATQEMLEFRTRALAAIRKRLCPELRPIMAGDADALERLAVKLARLEGTQEAMTEANKTIRKHAKDGAVAQISALVDLGFGEPRARDLLTKDFAGRIGFADYELKNNGAEIRRLTKRIEKLTAAKATADEVIEGAKARLQICPADNRVRLFYPGKPDDETRTRLARAGFRFSPRAGNAWQAYINNASVAIARREAGVSAPLPLGARCDAEIFKRGESLCVISGPEAADIEAWIIRVRERSGVRVDWLTVGGRAVIRYLGDRMILTAAVKALLPELNAAYIESQPDDIVEMIGICDLDMKWL